MHPCSRPLNRNTEHRPKILKILDRFFQAPVNICRNAAKIDGFDGRNEALTRWTVLFGLSATTPKQFHPMLGAAFGTDTFDCKTISMAMFNSLNIILRFP